MGLFDDVLDVMAPQRVAERKRQEMLALLSQNSAGPGIEATPEMTLDRMRDIRNGGNPIMNALQPSRMLPEPPAFGFGQPQQGSDINKIMSIFAKLFGAG